METFIIILFIVKVTIFGFTFGSIYFLTNKKRKTNVNLTSMLQNLDYRGTAKDAMLKDKPAIKARININ